VSTWQPGRERILEDWRFLCESIGERLGGTDAERRAGDGIAARLAAAGCRVHAEPFPCRARRRGEATVEVAEGGGWRRVEAAAVTGAGSTTGTVEGDAVWIELPEQAGRLAPGSLRGRVAILFGPLPESVEHHRALVAAEPLACIHVDQRLPFGWVKADGTYPLWVARYGFPPLVTVPYTEAWRWRLAGRPLRLRVRCSIDMADAESANIVGELAGSDPAAGVIVIGAHHDTQAGNVGADDNASGVVCLVELARLLAGRTRRRALRFVSFGVEEQLSVGSAAYALAHRDEMDRVSLMVNFDSVASPLGHHTVVCTGGADLERWARSALGAGGIPPATRAQAVPFADHFAFTVFGVPALWLYRENCTAGRWQHHSVHDNLANVSVDVVVELVAAVAHLLAEAADAPALPFARGLDPQIRDATLRYARDLFGWDV
jgi:hypothetical protein